MRQRLPSTSSNFSQFTQASQFSARFGSPTDDPAELSLGRINQILGAVAQLYTSTANPKLLKSIVGRDFSSSPTFEDPLVFVTGKKESKPRIRGFLFVGGDSNTSSLGKKNVYCQFRSLGAMFQKVEHDLDHQSIKSALVSEGLYTIDFDNTQRYFFLDKTPIPLIAHTQISIVFEEDKWVVSKLKDHWTIVPAFVAYVPGYTLARSVFGSITSLGIGLALK